MNIIKLTTEGDCEGRSTKTVGYFTGTIEQIITHCIRNNIKPMYKFQKQKVDIIDCSNIVPAVKVVEKDFGYLEFKAGAELHNEAIINDALSKLTKKEKELLGLNK